MSARMHRFLNHMARNHSDLSSMRAELSKISATRDSVAETVFKYMDAPPQPLSGMGEDATRKDSAFPDKDGEDLY